MICNQIQTNKRDGLPCRRYDCVVFNAGANLDCVRQRRETTDNFIRNPADRSDLQVGIPGEGFDGRAKRSRSRAAGEFNGKHDRNPKRHRQHDQRGTDGFAKEGANN